MKKVTGPAARALAGDNGARATQIPVKVSEEIRQTAALLRHNGGSALSSRNCAHAADPLASSDREKEDGPYLFARLTSSRSSDASGRRWAMMRFARRAS
jgi:hypothetical protein